MTTQRVSQLPLFVSTRRMSQVLGAFFLLTAAVSWIAVGFDLGEVRLFGAMQGGEHFEPAERLAHAKAGFLLGVAQILCALVLAALFVPWLFRSRVNVRAMGVRRMRYGREWTYLGFLIPIVNLFFMPAAVAGGTMLFVEMNRR